MSFEFRLTQTAVPW